MRLRPVNLGGLTLWSIDPDPVGECWPLGLSQPVALDVVETAITYDSGWQLSTVHSCQDEILVGGDVELAPNGSPRTPTVAQQPPKNISTISKISE